MKSAATNLAKFMIMSSTVIDCFSFVYCHLIAVAIVDNYSMEIPSMTPNEVWKLRPYIICAKIIP